MDITPLYSRVIGLDVHQAKISACALIEEPDGSVTVEYREFGAFKRDLRALAEWAGALRPNVVVMESTGVYWKSPYAALERAGMRAWVVNARHVKTVLGRKTDIADSQWLAILARAGLLRGAFIPPMELRNLRLIARQRQKLGRMLASEKNRLHTILSDAGIRLTVLISDLHGQAGRARVKAIIAGESMAEILKHTGRLKASREDLYEALQTEDLSETHRFVLADILSHIESLEAQLPRFEAQLLKGLAPWQSLLLLLQTVPGIDRSAPPCSWSRSAPTCVHSAAPSAWLPGQVSALATMRAPENERALKRARAMPRCGDCSVNLLRPRPGVAVP